jgi:hypothetical protein
LNRHIKIILSLFIVVSAQVANASIDTNRKITSAYANSFLQQASVNKAIELLQAHLSEDPQDSSNWSLLGKAYLQDNQAAKAVDAYKNAVKVASNEEAPAIHYSLAQAQAKNLQAEDAKKSLKLAASDPLNKSSVSNAFSELAAGKSISELKQKNTGFWKASTNVNAAYDDNVLMFSESLATSKRTDTASFGLAPSLDFVHEKPYGEGVIAFSPSVNGQFYTNEKAKFYDNLILSAGLDYSKNNVGLLGLKHSFGNTAKISVQNSNNFEFYNFEDTVKWSGQKELNNNQQITFSQDLKYQQYKSDSTAAAADNRNGVALKPQVNWQGSSAGGYNYTAGLSYEHLFAQGDNYISDTISVPLSVQTNLAKDINGKLGFTYSAVQYPKAAIERKDGNFSTTASFSKKFAKTYTGSVDLGFTKNTSSIENAAYSKTTIGIKVTNELF